MTYRRLWCDSQKANSEKMAQSTKGRQIQDMLRPQFSEMKGGPRMIVSDGEVSRGRPF